MHCLLRSLTWSPMGMPVAHVKAQSPEPGPDFQTAPWGGTQSSFYDVLFCSLRSTAWRFGKL